jgi:hypothetical protein
MGTDAVKSKHLKSARISDLRLVPMAEAAGRVIAFSWNTLFDGDSRPLGMYPLIRAFDYISKIVVDLLNRYTFVRKTPLAVKEILYQLQTLLDGVTGDDKLVNRYYVQETVTDDYGNDWQLIIGLGSLFPDGKHEVMFTFRGGGLGTLA